MYYRTCPHCQAHLDPGERCDCQDAKKEAAPLQRERPQEKDTMISLSARSSEVKTGGRLYDYR